MVYKHVDSIRQNIIVMGDIVEDVKMVDETKHDIVLKIGFLNDIENQSHMIEKYMDTFDMVIAGDGCL